MFSVQECNRNRAAFAGHEVHLVLSASDILVYRIYSVVIDWRVFIILEIVSEVSE